MEGWLGNAYLWVKAAHIIVVIFWMAGLFMLPRFLVYHQEAVPGSAEARAWEMRETRLIRIILTPAMVMVWLLGLMLALDVGAFMMGWFYAKLTIVITLSGYQGWLQSYAGKLAGGTQTLSSKALRIANEVPGIAIILIVLLVILRPF